jgi:hypothetical protein
MAAISKTQRDTHPENYQTIQTKYCNSHKQEILDRSRAYKQANPIKVKQWKAKSNNLKLISIKLQKCICPGCGIDFSMCNDLGLLMIFEKSHIHNKVCQLRNDKEFFWSCRICNVGKQSDKCGFWEAPLIFKELL